MIYKVRTIDKAGKSKKYKIEAESIEDLKLILKMKDLELVKVLDQISPRKDFYKRNLYKDQDLAIVFEQLALMVKQNVTLQRAFSVIAKQSKGRKKDKLNKLVLDLEKGYSLRESLERNTIFPKFASNLIYLGEETAEPGRIFEELAQYYRQKAYFENKFKAALAYPIILLFVSVFVTEFLIIYILPSFSEMLKDMGADLPLSTQILLHIAEFLNTYNIYILAGFLFLILLIYLLSMTKKFRFKMDKFIFSFKLAKRNFYYRFSKGMALALESGLTLQRGLAVCEPIYANTFIAEKTKKLANKLKEGISLSESMEELGIFSDILVAMVKSGEEASGLAEVLKEVSKHYLEELELERQRFTALIEPALILIMALLVGFIVISIAMPMFDIINRV